MLSWFYSVADGKKNITVIKEIELSMRDLKYRMVALQCPNMKHSGFYSRK